MSGWWTPDNSRLKHKAGAKTKKKEVYNSLLSGALDNTSLDNNIEDVHPLDQALTAPVPVSTNDGTGVHHRVAAAGLAGQALATVRRGDSAGAKCHSDHNHVLYPDNDHH